MTAEGAVPGDAGRIVEVIRQGFDPAWMGVILYGCAGVEHYVEAQIRLGASSPYRYKVCRQGGVIVGAAEFRILGATLFLNNVAVLPAGQGHGVGGTLLRVMVEEGRSQGLREFSLDVLGSNAPAVSWYERLGLKTTAERSYWLGTLPRAAAPGNYSSSDLAQANLVHARFGFSEFSVEGGSRTWKVGRLGGSYFRLVGWQCASDPGLAGFLGAMDSERKLLALVDGSPPEDVPWQLVAVTKRMSTPLEGLHL